MNYYITTFKEKALIQKQLVLQKVTPTRRAPRTTKAITNPITTRAARGGF